MGGLEGLINILDSESGFGSLEMQLLPEQASTLMNLTSRVSIPSSKSPKGVSGFHFPGYESYPENDSSIKMLEAAMQRLTNLCSVLNDTEPMCSKPCLCYEGEKKVDDAPRKNFCGCSIL